MDELIRLSKKAANEWRNTDAYYQAAVLIDSLCERLEKIENRNPQTNADRIRAMSDEELYLFAKKQIGCGFDCFPCGIVCDGKCKSFSEEDCREKIMNWLKQPAEET